MAKTSPCPKTPEAHRLARGLSLSDAALRIGIARPALQKVEAGAVGVSMATIERVAAFYGVTRAEIVAGCDVARRVA